MKKKAIERIPFKGSRREKGRYSNIVSVFTWEIENSPHLFIEIYKNKRNEREIPWIRMVFTATDWGLYYPEKGTWSSAGLEEINRQLGHYKKDIEAKNFIQNRDVDTIWDFCQGRYGLKTREYDAWTGALENLIGRIKNDRWHKRNNNRRIRLQERQQNTPALPEDLEKWADRTLFKKEHFMYYKRHGRYVDIACSACGHVTTTATKPTEGFEGQFEKIIPVPRANTAGYCPYCNTKGTYKTSGTVKGPYMLNSKCFVAQPYKETGVVVRYINVDKIYSLDLALEGICEIMTGAKERISITELTRTYFEKGKRPQTDYHKYSAISGEFWDDCNLDGYCNIRIEPAKIYEKSFEMLKDTFLQYSGAKEYVNYKTSCNLEQYLTRYMRYPQMEMLSKMGLYRIVESMTRCELGFIADQAAVRPEDFLGIRRERLKDLIIVQGDIAYLRAWQFERRNTLRLTEQESVFIREYTSATTDITEILDYTTVTKLMHKIENYSGVSIPKTLEGELCGRAADAFRTTAQLYADYIHMRLQREYDLHNQIFLFPRNLQRAHDQMVLETRTEEQKKREREVAERYPDIRKNYRKLRNTYFYEDETFLIRPARSAEEIVTEGRFLHHCVGGNNYLEKHNTGKTTILFLRTKQNPETPYITVEIQGTNILQWYGIRDTKPDKKRIESWLEKYTRFLFLEKEQRIRVNIA